jgi:streptomycin 6-kinase
VARLTIPENLARDVDAADSDDRAAWLRALPGVVGQLADRWSLTVAEPYRPGGSCSWVAPVTTSAGERLVLKVAWAHEESMHEAAGLRVWDGAGAVRLRAEHHYAHSSAMLLERCEPGTMLADVKSEPEQDLVIATLLQRLWVTPPPDHPFRPLELMCEQWGCAFEEALECSPTPLDPAIARDGIDLFRSLSKTGPRPVLLWTDLHAENVLAAEREAWLAIDPKPYVGDPAYDLVQHMLNCPDRLDDDPRGLARRMAGLTGLDPDRATAWLFARCVQESLGAPNLAAVATRLAREALS